MNRTHLITALECGLSNSHLRKVISSALALIHGYDQVSIIDHGEETTANKDSLLRIYRLRQKRAERSGGQTPDGFNETILSLASQTASRINLILVEIGNTSVVVLLDHSGSIVGCYFGKEVGDTIEE